MLYVYENSEFVSWETLNFGPRGTPLTLNEEQSTCICLATLRRRGLDLREYRFWLRLAQKAVSYGFEGLHCEHALL
jgi:hypothetical protein